MIPESHLFDVLGCQELSSGRVMRQLSGQPVFKAI
jgi:hypothetical protein